MEGRLCTIIKEKSHYLLSIFIALQGLIFLTISILMFSYNLVNKEFNVFATLLMFLFYGYMVHFAYHSIKNAYYIELIAFLIMSTSSSLISVITIFYFSFTQERNKDATLYDLGIVSAIILIIANLVYFFTAYFSYEYFEEKFIEKLGAKLKFHKMFYWIQFHNSMLKSEFGFYMILLFADYIYDRSNYVYVIIDTVLGVFQLAFLVIMRRAVKKEQKSVTITLLFLKLIILAYMGFRISHFYTHAEEYSEGFDFLVLPTRISSISYGICCLVYLILIVLSTFKCISYFEKGLKEALLSQTFKVFNKPEEDEV